MNLVFCNKDEALAFTGSDNLDSAIEKLRLLQKRLPLLMGPMVPLLSMVIWYADPRVFLLMPLIQMALGTCLQVPSCMRSLQAKDVTEHSKRLMPVPLRLLPSSVQARFRRF